MSHKDRARRLARKARRRGEREAEERAAEELRNHPTPINHSRLRQMFSTLSFRSSVRGGAKLFAGYVLGPKVIASTPRELDAQMNELYVEAVVGQPKN